MCISKGASGSGLQTKGAIKFFTNFNIGSTCAGAWKHLCLSLFFNEVADLGLQLLKKGDPGTGAFL